MILGAYIGMAVCLAFFCLASREFSDRDPTDDFIDELTHAHGDVPRIPQAISFHAGSDNR